MQDDRSFGSSGGLGTGASGTGAGAAGAGTTGTRSGMDDLEERADRAMSEAAETLQSAADRLDRLADRIPQKGVGNRAGAVGHGAADTLETVARFLRDNDVAGLQRDLGGLMSGRPLSMLLMAVGAGFVAGKLLR
jgi:hypothetical protein